MRRDDSDMPEVFSGERELGPYVGPWLTAGQYEALCRYALSREYGMGLGWVKRGHLQGPSKVNRHQIDLYWTSDDGVCAFLCIANAKFLKKRVSLRDVMTLLGVQQAVRAQKAIMITNTGYSEACVAQAKEDGVGLLIVRPAADFDPGVLPVSGNVPAEELEKVFDRRITPAYRMNVVHRAFDLCGVSGSAPGASPHPAGSAACGSPVGRVCVPAAPQGQSARPRSIPNKMVVPSVPSAANPAPLGIRRK